MILKEQLEELKRIVARLNDQDSRMTRDVFFIVYEKIKIITPEDRAEPECFDYFDYSMCETVGDDEKKKYEEMEARDEDLPEGIEKYFFQEVDRFVQAFLTEEGAKNYLKRNGHNLRSPFVYGDSLYRNAEMLTLKTCLPALVELAEKISPEQKGEEKS